MQIINPKLSPVTNVLVPIVLFPFKSYLMRKGRKKAQAVVEQVLWISEVFYLLSYLVVVAEANQLVLSLLMKTLTP